MEGTRPGGLPDAAAESGAESGADAAALALAVLIPVVASGGLVSKPLTEAGLLIGFFTVIAVASLPALAGSRWWRRPAPVLFALFWVVFALWVPQAMAATPDPVEGRAEIDGLVVCAAVGVAAVALSRGTRRGLAAFRAGWVLALLLTGAIAVVEILTGQHLWTAPSAPWRFGEGSIAASTFINPNNFSDALVGMLAGVVALHAASRRRAVRWVCAGLAVFALVLMVFTQSRGGLIGVLVIGALEAARVARDHLGGRSWRELATQHRRVVTGVGTAAGITLLASFAVPALAARNPLRATLAVAFSHETVRSDTLRLDLIASALRYWRESGFLGTGAGSFEPIMWSDPDSGVRAKTNLHNAFVELLTQYGIVVFLPYLALLLVLLVVLVLALRPGRVASRRSSATGRLGPTIPSASRVSAAGLTGHRSEAHQIDGSGPGQPGAGPGQPGADPDADRRVLRNELAGQLTAFVLLGVTASSALIIPFWWLSLANCVALAWCLDADARVVRRREDPGLDRQTWSATAAATTGATRSSNTLGTM